MFHHFFLGNGEARFGNFTEKFDKWNDKGTIDGLLKFLNYVLGEDSYIKKYENNWDGQYNVMWRLESKSGKASSPLGKNEDEIYRTLYKKVKSNAEYLDEKINNGKQGGIYKVYLNIRNPYIFDAKGDTFDNLKTEFSEKPINVNTLAQYVKDAGIFDGLIVKNVRETTYNMKPCNDYVVFKSNQIKHAYDNNGDFNSDSDDITENKKNVSSNKTNVIRFTESDLMNIVKECVARILNT